MNGANFSAADALAWGMVNTVVAQDELLPTVRKALGRIMRQSAAAVALSKEAVVVGTSTSLSAGLTTESELFAKAFNTPNAKEGVAAFLEGRKPKFEGRS